MRIKVADFTRFPGGRHRTDGPFSGQEFRENWLEPEFAKYDRLIVILDDVAGLPASFLEEAFGGLVREGFNATILRNRLSIVANSPRLRHYPDQVWSYIESAQKAI